MKIYEIISNAAIERRHYWIEEIVTLSGHFGADSSRVEDELSSEIRQNGLDSLLGHLRLCSAIPESYRHDSSEEKLYSKYTDALISECYSWIGLESVVLTERADSADVEAVTDEYSFVADAKVFRLSRTAKNQKDFKVQAMDGWKRGKPFAMVVCPLYQLPSRTSQIYQQAAARNVCIFSYSHLSVLARLTEIEGKEAAINLLHEVFNTVQAMNPSKNANAYWQAVNRAMLRYSDAVNNLWETEKIATIESIVVSKEIALKYYASKREEIMRLSHREAIEQLIEMHKINSRIDKIRSVSDNLIMNIG
ncbi:MAG: HindIII family type II restriction endonuclease [Gammaproteobacteria bacterium]|nr:HindIII family type II restriction endonuclease [Gammaproteobacteria bacterium]